MKHIFNRTKSPTILSLSRIFATIGYDNFTVTCTESDNRPAAAMKRAVCPYDQRRDEAVQSWKMLARIARSLLPTPLRQQFAFTLNMT